jgi:hypothetical protein
MGALSVLVESLETFTEIDAAHWWATPGAGSYMSVGHHVNHTNHPNHPNRD